MTDRKKVIEGLEEAEILLTNALDRSGTMTLRGAFKCRNNVTDAITLLKEQEAVVRCKDCKHLFDGEHTENCCDALMEKAGWLKEISVSSDWFCADGERKNFHKPVSISAIDYEGINCE